MRVRTMVKNKNSYWKKIATVSAILAVLLGAAIGYGILIARLRNF